MACYSKSALFKVFILNAVTHVNIIIQKKFELQTDMSNRLEMFDSLLFERQEFYLRNHIEL